MAKAAPAAKKPLTKTELFANIAAATDVPKNSDFSRAVHLPDSWVPPHFSPAIPPRYPHDSLVKCGVI